MASNFARRLDKLERIVRERMQPDTSPLYLRDGQTIADGIDPARVIFIKRVLIEPPEREQEELPELQAEPEVERKPTRILVIRYATQTQGSSDCFTGFQGKIWLSSADYSARLPGLGNAQVTSRSKMPVCSGSHE